MLPYCAVTFFNNNNKIKNNIYIYFLSVPMTRVADPRSKIYSQSCAQSYIEIPQHLITMNYKYSLLLSI